MSLGTGVVLSFFNYWWSPSHRRCDLLDDFLFLDFVFLIGFWAGWISHFQGSRGGNDTRLHCLGSVEIPGFVFGLFFALIILVYLVFLYIGLGIGDTRSSLLTCRGCGWLGLVVSETMGCGVVSLKSISWGSLAVWGES